MEKVDTLIVDKTGTLTEGKPKLSKLIAGPGFDDQSLLQLAASLERGSEHPLAEAIVAAAMAVQFGFGDREFAQINQGQVIAGKIA